MIQKPLKFDFNDITLIPSVVTNIKSRKEIDLYDEYGKLRLFTSPMFDVVNKENMHHYIKNNINVILPRQSSYNKMDVSYKQGIFYSYGLKDIQKLFIDNKSFYLDMIENDSSIKFYVLIDIANGHMQYMFDTVDELKEIYNDNIVIMAGNIANPKTYALYCHHKIDYVRVGIGGGSACLTSANTSIHYPMASMLSEINDDYTHPERFTKIIVDGGIKSFADIIKAYNLGADYVMLGSIFNKSLESAGDTYYKTKDGYNKIPNDKIYNYDMADLYKMYRGMSTKDVQRELKRKTLQTSEGITKYNKIEYTLKQWVDNYKDYLSSALSYMNYKSVTDCIGSENYILITQNAFKRFNK